MSTVKYSANIVYKILGPCCFAVFQMSGSDVLCKAEQTIHEIDCT